MHENSTTVADTTDAAAPITAVPAVDSAPQPGSIPPPPPARPLPVADTPPRDQLSPAAQPLPVADTPPPAQPPPVADTPPPTPPPGYLLVPPRPPLALAPEWRPRAPRTRPARDSSPAIPRDALDPRALLAPRDPRALLRDPRASLVRDPRSWLVAYGVLLALIAFWPTPVDRNAAGLLHAISAAIPWLSYNLIEFTANIALFVPLGALGAMLLRRRPWLVIVIALGVTIVIESVQALLLAQRTPSGLDIIANTLGAAVGLAIVLLVRRRSGS
ncbi:VanZ family protein [Microbacterium marmarense]|uniref:VanZ family protein n=1 Tax=Microbacterium marmarense TaxID=3122051 RepID=A0ABU8LY76_9MICO